MVTTVVLIVRSMLVMRVMARDKGCDDVLTSILRFFCQNIGNFWS